MSFGSKLAGVVSMSVSLPLAVAGMAIMGAGIMVQLVAAVVTYVSLITCCCAPVIIMVVVAPIGIVGDVITNMGTLFVVPLYGSIALCSDGDFDMSEVHSRLVVRVPRGNDANNAALLENVGDDFEVRIDAAEQQAFKPSSSHDIDKIQVRVIDKAELDEILIAHKADQVHVETTSDKQKKKGILSQFRSKLDSHSPLKEQIVAEKNPIIEAKPEFKSGSKFFGKLLKAAS